jgi:hypothetical protein
MQSPFKKNKKLCTKPLTYLRCSLHKDLMDAVLQLKNYIYSLQRNSNNADFLSECANITTTDIKSILIIGNFSKLTDIQKTIFYYFVMN